MFFFKSQTVSKKYILLAASLFASLSLSSPLMAQEKAQQSTFDPDAIVFSVNGKDFTNRDLATAAVDFNAELQRIPPAERRDGLIEIMVNMELLAKAGKEEKLDETDEFARRLDQLKTRALRNFYIRKIIHPQITQEKMQERYVEYLARFEPHTEIRARHILLEKEDEAKAVIKELDGGKDFAELAKEKSTGPSGPNGGDLGFFGPDQMVAPFQEAASKLEAGAYSKQPVKTQFGWHVIKVEETRQTKAPAYEQVQAEIGNALFNEMFAERISELRKEAKINIVPLPGQEKAKEENKQKAQ